MQLTRNNITVELVATEQKRSEVTKRLMPKKDKDGQVIMNQQGQPLMEEVIVAKEKDSFPFLKPDDQTMASLVSLFGPEVCQKQLIASFSRIFQKAWFNDSEKDETKYLAILQAEEIGSTRERTSLTVQAEMKAFTKAGQPQKALDLLPEFQTLLQKEVMAKINGK